MSNSAHDYHGMTNGRGQRLTSKLGRTISVKRLDRLLKPKPRKEVTPMTIDTEKPDKPDDAPDKPSE